ncbi:binding-protein-dependent transport systems inner membrane component [Komagataeibacter xylinus E25]|nr:binding-protein-dependent transport systems inner membrane component [Komagataeibacter xylinus E25]
MILIQHRKAIRLQAFFCIVIAVACVLCVYEVYHFLQERGVASGFGFLERATGWDVGFSLIPYTINDPYWRVILVGLLNTLFLGISSIMLATLIGIVVGLARISDNLVMSFLSVCYIEVMRNVPLILQIFFWYALFIHLPPPKQAITVLGGIIISARGIFLPGLNVSPTAAMAAGILLASGVVCALIAMLLPRRSQSVRMVQRELVRISLLGSFAMAVATLWLGRLHGLPFLQVAQLKGLNFQGGVRLSPEFGTLLTGISLYGGAFMGEIIRAGLMAVNKGQIEAAKALGLAPWKVFTRVRLPLAFRMVLPTLTNQYVWLLKATSLGIVVGFADLYLVVSTSIIQSGQTIELLGIMMLGFILINNLLAVIMNFVNRRIALRGTQLRM